MKKNLHFVITAGPTREYLDPVRFLSNPSTGKMGFAVARAAKMAGYKVTLIAGPVSLKTPTGVNRINVVSACDMLKAAEEEIFSSEKNLKNIVFVSTAAVADWRPKKCATQKLKKDKMTGVLELSRNPDILKTISAKAKGMIKLVGFAAETNDVLSEAARKCRVKGLSLIVANDVTEKGAGFGTATNKVVFVHPDGSLTYLPLLTKLTVAKRLIKEIEALN